MYTRWNKSKINDQIKTLTKMFKEDPSMELALAINTLDDLKNNTPNIFPKEFKFEEQLHIDKRLVDNNSGFIPHIGEFAKLDDIFNIKYIPPLEERGITNSLLLSFLHDFYNSIDREISKYFNRIYKERHNNLRITSKNNEGFNRNYLTYINELKYGYINIYRTETIDDFINIIHEYAHGVADQMCYRPRYGKYPFIELMPLLMQEIAYDEMIRCFEDVDNDVLKSDACTTKTMLKYAKELLLQTDYLSIVNESPERKQFVNNFAEYTNNTKSKTEKMLNITIQEKLSYVIPFITMIELYNLYYLDPDKCMYVLKKIITMEETDDYVSYLEGLGIHLNEHSEQYISDQKKILKLTL